MIKRTMTKNTLSCRDNKSFRTIIVQLDVNYYAKTLAGKIGP